MKMKSLKLSIVILLVFVSGAAFAQSDYERVQNFKNEIAQIRTEIKKASTLAELDSLQFVMDELRDKYRTDQELLDKSLYPENYMSTFANLRDELELRKLNEKNTELLSKIKEYQSVGGEDARSINELRQLVSDLRQSLKKRDRLVRSIVDSLLADFVKHPMTLNEAEKQQMFEKVETGNLFYNIEKTIRDNMEFLRTTQLQAEDLGEVKENQVLFYNTWKKIGPKLADVYMNKGEKAGEVAYITNLFAQWNQKVDQEIWNRVQADLRESEMKLKPFANGDEFTSNLLEYINESKISASQSDYEKFESSIWTQKLKAAWLPILIDNGMLTVKQKELMQTAVDDWGSMYEEETPIYWYIAIVVIVLIIVLIFVPKWKKKNKPLAGQ
jgi:uncharacterized integral membrane protein